MECIICYEELEVKSSCNHGYCVRCYDTWFSKHSTCPYCRQKVISKYSSNLQKEIYALTGGKLII
jgi:hypothetical protein